MQLACIHTHTVFCDGKDDVETCCQRAHEKGLGSIGFSSHAPITPKTGLPTIFQVPIEKLEDYITTVRAAQKRWKDRLPVYLGLEVDFIPGLMGPADRDYREMGLDFIIGSVHYVVPPHGQPFTVDDSAENVDRGIKEEFGGDPLAMVESYWNSQEALIRAGGFDILAHPDLIKKNNSHNRLFSEDDDSYRRRTAAVAALMAVQPTDKNNRPVTPVAEINTGGWNRGKIKDCYPSSFFLEKFREKGIPMIINADAHRAEDLGGHYEEARAALLAAGYTETVVFEGRKNGRAVWGKVKL